MVKGQLMVNGSSQSEAAEPSAWLGRQYVVRKAFSMFRRMSDLINHARIFPLDSLRFFPAMLVNGVRSAMRGEG